MLGMENVVQKWGYTFIRVSFLKGEMEKKLDTYNISITIYLEMTVFCAM